MLKSNWGSLRSKLLIGLVLIQALFLIGIALSFYAIGWYGKEIRLQTVPVDPRDLMYGDYVELNYDINMLKTSLWKGRGIINNDTAKNLYVVLKPDALSKNGTYEAVGIYDHKPSLQDDEVYLKGHFDYLSDDSVRIKYGLETYYISENTGKALEEKAQKGALISKVKVAPWGRSQLVELVVP